MKKLLSVGLALALVVGVLGVMNLQTETEAASWTYEDANYRGTFSDRGVDQVSVQISLEDNIVTDLTYRHLYHGGTDYRELEEGDSLYGIVEQFEQVADYLEGEDVRTALEDLHEPGEFVEDVDVASGATLRANKVISAVRDALNRGAYSY
ncbi:FMN-binding protein [Natroniella sulfidigena]|uniref:FMN-binding protein n=1 Tax=Natroniella sulfidigena TaxID=723921 RepID=UPI00200B6482|nr:FMN-binding protein [Natroniella sulfidigena]MCK8817216.1 FMN-binding protein [Natroniella sulfidigena]